jgi:hypothetical protein
MATILRHSGWEVHTTAGGGIDTNYSQKTPRSLTGRYSFCAIRSASASDSLSYTSIITDNGADTLDITFRFKLRVDELPTGGNGLLKVAGLRNNRSGFDVLLLVLDGSGYLNVYRGTSANAAVLLYTSAAPLDLDTEYLIEVIGRINSIVSQPGPNPPYDTDGYMAVRIDGSTVWSDNVVTVESPDAWHDYLATSWSSVTLCADVNTAFTATRAVVSFDDFACGVPTTMTDFLGDGYSVAVTGIDYGAELGWGIDDASLEYLCRDNVNGQGNAVGTVTSTSALDVFTVLCPSLTSFGVPGGANIRQVSVYVQPVGFMASMRAVLIVNGTTHYSASKSPQNTGEVYTEYTFPGVSVLPTDTIEIGMEKDNTATSRQMAHIWLSVEVDTFVEARPSRDVEVKVGTYTGNGSTQEIIIGFKPTFLLFWPVSNSSAISVAKTKSAKGWWLPACNFHTGAIGGANYIRDNLTEDGIILGLTSTVNDSGISYAVLAIRDPSFRVYQYSGTRGGLDGQVQPWVGEFVARPDVAFQWNLQNSNLDSHSRWPYHSGDQSKESSAASDADAAKADAIQAMDSNDVELGDAAGTGSTIVVCGFRDATFYDTQLVGVAQYTGDGSSSRTIALTGGLATKTPTWVMLTPDATRVAASPLTTTDYDCIATSGHASGRCTEMRNNTLKTAGTGITALGVGSIEVSGNYNISGVVYSLLIFADGEDIEPITDSEWPESPNDEEMPRNPPEEETDWMIDWPDDAPGLLGVVARANRYEPDPEPVDGRMFWVSCEQRSFPVDDHTIEFKVPYESREFDSLEEF